MIRNNIFCVVGGRESGRLRGRKRKRVDGERKEYIKERSARESLWQGGREGGRGGRQ